MGGMRPHDEQVHLAVPDELERLVRERHRPVLADRLRQLGEDEAERDAVVVGVVIAEGAGDVRLVPQVDDGVAPHVGEFLLLGRRGGPSLQPQRGAETPVRREVLLDLAVDGPDRRLQRLVLDLALGVIDHGNDHGDPPPRWKVDRMTGGGGNGGGALAIGATRTSTR